MITGSKDFLLIRCVANLGGFVPPSAAKGFVFAPGYLFNHAATRFGLLRTDSARDTAVSLALVRFTMSVSRPSKRTRYMCTTRCNILCTALCVAIAPATWRYSPRSPAAQTLIDSPAFCCLNCKDGGRRAGIPCANGDSA